MAEAARAALPTPSARPRRLAPWIRWYPVWLRNARTWRTMAIPSLVGNFGEPALYLLALGYGLGALVGDVGGMPYVTFLASGIVCSSAMMTASFEALYSSYTRMATQRTWDAMITTPLEVRDVVVGEIVWAATKSLLPSTAIVVVASAMGVLEGWRSALALPVTFLTAACFASLAMIVTAVARTYDFFLFYTTLVVTPMFLLGGVFFPVSQLGSEVRELTALLPLAHGVAVVRPLVTGGVPSDVVEHLAVLGLFSAVATGIAVRLVRRRLLA